MTNSTMTNRSLTIVAMTICDRLGVNLKFKDDVVPWTDGDTIVIPPLRDDLSQEDRDSILASLIHECGHVRYTDMQAGKDGGKVAFQLCNGLEDPRIEVKMEDVFLSARRLFTEERARLIPKFVRNLPKRSLLDVATFFVLCKGSFLLGRQDDADSSAKAFKVLSTRLGDKTAQAIDQLVESDFLKCTCTAEVWALAQKIAALLPQQQASDSGSQPQSQKQGKSSKAKGKGKGKKSNSQQAGSPTEGQPTDSQPASDQSTDSQPSSASSSDTMSASGEPCDGQPSEGSAPNDKQVVLLDAKGELKQPLMDLSKQNFHAACKKASLKSCDDCSPFDLKSITRQAGRVYPWKPHRDETFFTKVNQHARHLGRVLHSFVQSTRREHSLVGACGVRAKGSALSRLAVGNPRVFEKNTRVKGVDTAVQIMLDQSGSMGIATFNTALTAALSLFEALRVMPKVSAGVATYCTYNGSAQIAPLVSFGGSLTPSVKDRIIKLDSDGGTPHYAAVTASGFFLAKRREERKVVFYITDDSEFTDKAATMVKQLQAEGVLFIGLCINLGQDASKLKGFEVLRNVITIKSIDELEKNLFGLAKRIFY